LTRDNRKTRDTGRTTRHRIIYVNCDRSVPSLQFITETGLVSTLPPDELFKPSRYTRTGALLASMQFKQFRFAAGSDR